MGTDREALLSIAFAAVVIEWRGPAPFLFASIPEVHGAEIRHAGRLASYGWGVVPVEASIAGFGFETSLIPRDGAYLLPIKRVAQQATGVGLGDQICAEIRIFTPVS